VSNYVILDTDVFSAICAGNAEKYETALRNAEQALTFVSVAELHYGARLAGWGTRRTTDLSEKIRRLSLVPYHQELPEVWASLRDSTRRRGHPLAQPVNTNDLWIAACAVLNQAPLLTRNRRHFQDIPELNLIELDGLEGLEPSAS
jgi:predicted nucleic acid-binding protein